MSILYAAYGSNMSETQMSIRCPDSRLIGAGWLPAFKLIFDSYSSNWLGAVADVEPTGDHAMMVPIALYDISPRDLSRLDEFEGYPAKYNRRMMNVMLKNGQHASALVYYLMNNHKGTYGKPSDKYFKQIRSAYIRFKFAVSKLDDVVAESIRLHEQRAALNDQTQPTTMYPLTRISDEDLQFLEDWN
jgi:gamma-glutamylcyclotransferase (GGCT)/AIG2-like uncharacterized protein YtfP